MKNYKTDNEDLGSDSLLEIEGLGKVYPSGTRALSDINLNIAAGEFISIVGLSGSGKSTLIRCINRMIEPTEGRIHFIDEEICGLRGTKLRHLRTRIGMVFQHYNLVPRLTVLENVLHGRLGYKSTFKGAVGWYTHDERLEAMRILEELNLGDYLYKRCDQLSGGQKQRVGIARALIQHPRLILGDEPVASLDPKSSKKIMDTLRHINRERGITCILNLHQVEFAVEYSDRILGIRAGRIVFDGPPEDFNEFARETVYGQHGVAAGEGDLVAAS